MRRTTIMVPEEILERIRGLASERRVSMAAVIREALEAKAQTYHPMPRPKPKSLGMGDSGQTDTARRSADELPEPPPWR